MLNIKAHAGYCYSKDAVLKIINGSPPIALATELDVPEIIVSTFAETREDRFHSYELLAKMFSIAG